MLNFAIVENVATASLSSAFLIVDGEVIYEIAPNSVLNIGRLDTNDIVLDDYKVSREHAVLKYSGQRVHAWSIWPAPTAPTSTASASTAATLHFGDTIQIVSHELTLSRELPGIRRDRSILMPKMARIARPAAEIFRRTQRFSLLTLVQFLHQEKQSGLLLLELGQNPGPRIYFQDGEIIHVAQGENLAELLTRKHHEQSLFFYFHHETNFPERTIAESTPNYLMSLCHQ